MSKRGATFQLSKEGKFNGDGQPPDGGGSERDENDAPTRATAAQLAKRKIKEMKIRRTPSPGFGSGPSVMALDASPFALPSSQNSLFGAFGGGAGTASGAPNSLPALFTASSGSANGTTASQPNGMFGGFGSGGSFTFGQQQQAPTQQQQPQQQQPPAQQQTPTQRQQPKGGFFSPFSRIDSPSVQQTKNVGESEMESVEDSSRKRIQLSPGTPRPVQSLNHMQNPSAPLSPFQLALVQHGVTLSSPSSIIPATSGPRKSPPPTSQSGAESPSPSPQKQQKHEANTSDEAPTRKRSLNEFRFSQGTINSDTEQSSESQSGDFSNTLVKPLNSQYAPQQQQQTQTGLFMSGTLEQSQPSVKRQQQSGGIFGSVSGPTQTQSNVQQPQQTQTGLFAFGTLEQSQPPAKRQQQSGGIFGSVSNPTQNQSNTQQPQQTQPGFFTSTTPQQNQPSGLPQQQSGSLFGRLTMPENSNPTHRSVLQPPKQGGGLFTVPDNSSQLQAGTQQPPQQSGGLFGRITMPDSSSQIQQSTQQPQKQAQSGLSMPGTPQQNQLSEPQQQSSGLFGRVTMPDSSNQTQQPQQAGGFFGGGSMPYKSSQLQQSTQQPQQQTGGLFGSLSVPASSSQAPNNAQQQKQIGGLFGRVSMPDNSNQNQQQQPAGGLFGSVSMADTAHQTQQQQPQPQQTGGFLDRVSQSDAAQLQPQTGSFFTAVPPTNTVKQQQIGGVFNGTPHQDSMQQPRSGGLFDRINTPAASTGPNAFSQQQPGSIFGYTAPRAEVGMSANASGKGLGVASGMPGGQNSGAPSTINAITAPSNSPSASSTVKNIFGSELKTLSSPGNASFGSHNNIPAKSLSSPSTQATASSGETASVVRTTSPVDDAQLSEEQKASISKAAAIYSLNAGLQKHIANLNPSQSFLPALQYYFLQIKRIHHGEVRLEDRGENATVQEQVNDATPPSAEDTHVTSTPSKYVAISGAPGNKRKADEDITRDDNAEEGPKKSKTDGSASPSGRSQTSNLFASIVDNPQQKQNQISKDQPPITPFKFTPQPSKPDAISSTERASTTTPAAASSLFKPSKASASAEAPLSHTAQLKGTSDNTGNPAAEIPKFGSGTSTNFFGQFGQAPAKTTESPFQFKPTDPSNPARAPPLSLFPLKPISESTDKALPASSVTPPANPFQLKQTSVTANTAAGGPPKFGSGATSNFVSQFGQAAAKTAEEARKKRKAEDYDSDEETLEEWERRDAEEQANKRAKLEDASKGKLAKFVPGKGFVLEDDASTSQEAASAPAPPKFGSSTPAPAPPTFGSTTPAPAPPRFGSSTPAPAPPPNSTGISAPTLPKFGSGGPVNFFSQFAQSAAKTAEQQKRKRKDEDYDSDEETQEQWEKRDAEEQAKKRAQLEEASKGKVAKFIPGKGFVLDDDASKPQEATSALAPPKFGSSTPAPAPPPNSTGISAPTLPKFGSGGPVNFSSQFAQSAAKTAEQQKQKRKDEDYDSDEETQEQWEKRDAEEQAKKRAQLEEASNDKVAKFIPGQGFVLESKKSSSDQEEKPPSSQSQGATPKLGTFGMFGATNPASSQPFVFGKPTTAVQQPTSNMFGSLSQPGSRLGLSGAASPASSQVSIFENPASAGANPVHNIFGHLSETESGAEGRDAEDEESQNSENDEPQPKNKASAEKSAQRSLSSTEGVESAKRSGSQSKPDASTVTSGASTPGRSLFDRIQHSVDGKPVSEVPAEFQTSTEPPKQPSFVFGTGSPSSSSSVFGQSSTLNLFGGAGKNTAGDNTWKGGASSPIKFGGGPSFGTPSFEFNPSSTESQTDKSRAGDSQVENKAQDTPAKPFPNVLGGAFTAPPKAANPSAFTSFSFGGPKPAGTQAGLLFPQAIPSSQNTSRATTPGTTTDGGETGVDSTAEGGDAEAPTEQTDLSGLTAQEKKAEDLLYEIPRAKCLQFESLHPDEKAAWQVKGLGPLRIMKNKSSGVVRMLMRAAPGGQIVLNARLLAKIEYRKSQGKCVQFAVNDKDGKLVSTMIRVGKDDVAAELAKILEENKAK